MRKPSKTQGSFGNPLSGAMRDPQDAMMPAGGLGSMGKVKGVAKAGGNAKFGGKTKGKLPKGGRGR